MAQRLIPPFVSFVDSTGAPYSGGSLTFYAAGSSSALDTYSDEALSTANSNPLTLNARGSPSVSVFGQNLPYKIVLKDSAGAEIGTIDNVYGTDLKSVAILKVNAGNPNGSVAGTAGSSGVLPTTCWDYTNSILYVCTTTGTTLTAVWTAINAAAATAVVIPPQGYLTPTSGTPVIASDVASATAVYYEPFVGNQLPIYNGSAFTPTTFAALTLTLHSSHATNTIYDVFAFSNSGVVTLVTGPAWSNSGAGTSSRGTGAGTTQLSRVNGYLTNAVSMTGRNGSSTYTVGANLGTYLGSIFIDGTAGQVTCHRAWGQSRKWGVWNAYNRQPLYLKAGDGTASWSYTTLAVRASNGAAANSLTVFCGLAEEFFDLSFSQRVTPSGPNPNDMVQEVGIGWNSTSTMSGRKGFAGMAAGLVLTTRMTAVAQHLQAPTIGINRVTALENLSANTGTGTWHGAEEAMMLLARWRG